ncbi:MAG TPA: folylpolyglutamate synthase/dihydrofolate synthase family protein [Abditibacteriaceae bacterium]|jgi:dihydrofolate synthase/folylpolyglutamate synthase
MTQLQSYLAQLQRFGIHPGLERIGALLEQAGDPQRSYPVILVGGTNGKGSTCEFLARTLANDGLKTGLYTSPHLYAWNERIRVLDSDTLSRSTPHTLFPGIISDTEMDTLFRDAQEHLQRVAADVALGQPTEFETLTFLSLLHFARAKVDAAVVEVGLGGRWDATNVTQPSVSVITHVALDHCDRLGSTLEEIALDKVAIARPNRVLVTAETKPPVLEVLQRQCESSNARLWSFRAPDWSNDRALLEQTMASLPLDNLQQNAEPTFQHINRATALVARAAFTLAQPDLGLAQRTSSAEYSVPGRLEVLRRNPTVLIDGANNPDGAAHLAAQIRPIVHSCGGRLFLVLGILADKDYRAMIATLAPLAHTVIATQSESPRAAAATEIAREAALFCEHVEVVTPVNAACQRALALAQPHDVICVTGSFYTVAEVERSALQNDGEAS